MAHVATALAHRKHTRTPVTMAEHTSYAATEHMETRLAADGKHYTYNEIAEWYGIAEADDKWRICKVTTEGTIGHVQAIATEHGRTPTSFSSSSWGMLDTSSPSSPVVIPPYAPAVATEQNRSTTVDTPSHGPPVATEHSTPPTPEEGTATVLAPADFFRAWLDINDIASLRAAERARTPRRSLHKLAREALNTIAAAGADSDVARDLDAWFPWREYLALHENAVVIIASGITHAVAEFIDVRDPNRGGQARLDFVFYRADGSYCRLHPGITKSHDAKPVILLLHTPATERHPAQLQLPSIPELPFTYTTASGIPKTDQIGKEEAYQSLQHAPLGALATIVDAPFKWWLFACNLGNNTREVIGGGIIAAALETKWDHTVQILFTRSDNTEARVQITQPPRGKCWTRLLRDA